MSTVNEALKSLILALGGDPESMYDNTTVSDYIKDLETAMQASGSGVEIDDSAPSETKVYSSSKTESLIPANELPEVAAGDIGKVLSVVSDGEGGAEFSVETMPTPSVTRVTIQLSITGEDEYAADMNYETIKSHYDNGALLFLNNASADASTHFWATIPLSYARQAAFFEQITPIGTENPQEAGWYEYAGSGTGGEDQDPGEYVLSSDTEVNSEKDYYKDELVFGFSTIAVDHLGHCWCYVYEVYANNQWSVTIPDSPLS